MTEPKISRLITDVIAHIKTLNADGKIQPGLKGCSEWTHRGLLSVFPYVIVTANAESGDDGDSQDVEAVLSINVHTQGGKPENLAPQTRKLAWSIKKQLDFHDGRWGGAHLYWQNTTYHGWFKDDVPTNAPEGWAILTFRAAYKENIE